jgi:peptide/nickel transport system substrate-binding protein
MKKLRWQLLIIFLTGLVVGILLLGEQPQKLSPITETSEPVKGGVYTEALVGSLLRLNPLLVHYNAPDRDVSRLIFSGLVRFDPNGSAQPDLAESVGATQDGTIYNVTLRKNARWHDGKPVTADDVVFTVGLLKKGGDLIPADLVDFWKDIEVVKLSDTVLQFRLPEAFAPFPDYLAFGILPKHLLDGKTIDQIVDMNFNIAPVGSGPYQFKQLDVEDSEIKGIDLAAFKDYYGQKPYIDEIVFRYYPDANTALQAYQAGQVQGIGNVTADILPEVLSEPKLAIFTARQPELSMVLFNLKSQEAPFLNEPKVRQALFTGLNRQAIVDKALQGQAVIADGPILPDTWAYYDGLKHVEFDPEAATALLKDAGYTLAAEGDVVRKKGDVALRFELLYPDDEQHRAIAESIRSNWQALGAEVTLTPATYDSLLKDHLEARDYQAALVDLNLSRTPDPDPYPFWDLAQATGGQNYTQWENRVASEYLEQARVTVNLQDRIKYYRNFQILFTQDLPALPLYYPVYTYAVDRDIQGVRVGPLFDTADRFANVTDWFLAGRQKKEAAAPAVKP